MQPADDDTGDPKPENGSLEETMSKLREIGNEGGQRDDTHVENPAALTQHMARLRLAMQSHKTVTAVSLTCASAGVIAVLKILSEYFE